MPFTDEQPFLDAIFARYHDDGPRFIYADFLDDAGDPERGELVRVQVALSRMTEDHPKHAELKNQEAELREANLARWCSHLSDLDLEQCEFRRGVLDSVVVNAATFLEKGDELFRRVPVRRIQLRDSSPVIASLASAPLLENVRELVLCGESVGNGGVNLLVRSPFLKKLELLDLGFNGIDDAGVTALARASTLPKLSSLSLSANGHITSTGIMELAASPFFGGLTSLDLFGNDIDDAGLKAIIASKTFTALNMLRISENHIGDTGISALSRSSLLERIFSQTSRLEIRTNQIGPSGIAMLAGSPMLSRCTSLDLNHNEIGDIGLAAILRSPHFENLQVLKVSHNLITDKGIEKLRDCWPGVFGKLRNFEISENQLTSYGCRMLGDANAKNGNATILDVSRNNRAEVKGFNPFSQGEKVQGDREGVSDIEKAAELKRRVSYPSMRAGDRPNHHS
jgi:uncharacterized protein (TIGR02996 family)